MSIFQPSNQAITFNYNLTAALSFRAKLLLAMMLVVLAVTIATVYLAEENRRANQQRALDAQFQNQVQSFLKIQETQSEAITEKCRALSHAVRLRAALEERDVDDMYRNALTELEGILEHPGDSTGSPSDVGRASFFRFLDAEGQVLPPENHPAGLTDQPSLHEALSAMGKVLRETDEQAVGYIALARGNQPSALREVVLTKIRDPNGRNLGTLVVGFPIGHLQDSESGQRRRHQSGIWLNQRLYMENLGAAGPASHRSTNQRSVEPGDGQSFPRRSRERTPSSLLQSARSGNAVRASLSGLPLSLGRLDSGRTSASLEDHCLSGWSFFPADLPPVCSLPNGSPNRSKKSWPVRWKI